MNEDDPGAKPIKGRGASSNPNNRFQEFHREIIPENTDLEEAIEPDTKLLRDTSQSIISFNDSPDVPFDASINPYRGCEHGCIYCYARPTHEMLGFSAGLDFESRILVKDRAPELLEEELSDPDWTPQVLAISGVTDPYQPVEKSLGLTRKCLNVLEQFQNPAGIVTKNELVSRDIDILKKMVPHNTIRVNVSVTTLDRKLCRLMEPRTSQPHRRLKLIEELSEAGIPTNVLVAPVIPGLTDHEIPEILEEAASSGAQSASYVPLRLPHSVKDLFLKWLKEHYPAKKSKVVNRLKQIRGGRLNDPEFNSRMQGEGVFAEQIKHLFKVSLRNTGLDGKRPPLNTNAFRRPGPEQMELF